MYSLEALPDNTEFGYYDGALLDPGQGWPARRAGLGDAGQNISLGTSAASIASGAGLAAHLIPAAAAGPIGLAIAGVGLALSLIFSRRGPAQKVATTHIVDAVEPELAKNRDGYLSGPRTPADQQAAIANFDYAWAQVKDACSNPQYGNPGQACIADRQPGGKWDWFKLYRDPIADDTPVQPSPAADISAAFADVGSMFSLAPSAGSSPASLIPLVLAGVLIAAAVSS